MQSGRQSAVRQSGSGAKGVVERILVHMVTGRVEKIQVLDSKVPGQAEKAWREVVSAWREVARDWREVAMVGGEVEKVVGRELEKLGREEVKMLAVWVELKVEEEVARARREVVAVGGDVEKVVGEVEKVV